MLGISISVQINHNEVTAGGLNGRTILSKSRPTVENVFASGAYKS